MNPRWTLTLLLTLVSCARAPLRLPEQQDLAFKPVDPPEALKASQDDLDFEAFLNALQRRISHLKSKPQETWKLGAREVSSHAYADALARALAAAQGTTDEKRAKFFNHVSEHFETVAPYGVTRYAEVFSTAYYTEHFEGSLKRKGRFTQALYGRPRDLAFVDLALFDPKLGDLRKFRGRLETREKQIPRLVPYFSREEIDSGGSLRGRGLELCFVDPIDAFFLHVQGSGLVSLAGGKTLTLNYSERNGQRYESLGAILKARLPKDEVVDLAKLETYLRALPPTELQAFLNFNPSYIFFEAAGEPSRTTSGVPATPGRTIATDPKIFPKGMLGYLSLDVFTPARATDPNAPLQPLRRFVFDDDTGGAITGPGRMDLFIGTGPEAKRMAGAVQNRGDLVFFVPK